MAELPLSINFWVIKLERVIFVLSTNPPGQGYLPLVRNIEKHPARVPAFRSSAGTTNLIPMPLPRIESDSLNFKDFSEIDYFFSSNLAETAWGVDRLLQRIILFDPIKRHIPYLILMHITFYNNTFDRSQKKVVLNKLINELYKNAIKKTTKNPITDFIPPYFVMCLLLDLFIAGYNVKPLMRKLKADLIQNPVMSIKKYGNFSIEGFPEALLFFFEQLVFFKDTRQRLIFQILNKGVSYGKLLSEMAQSSILSNNFNGYDHVFKKIKEKEFRHSAQFTAITVYIEHKEISRALNIAESASTLQEKFFMYSDISFALLMDDQVEIVHEIERNISVPEIKFALAINTVNYYIRKQVKEKALRAIEAAYDLKKLIKDFFFQTVIYTFLYDFEYRLGREKEAALNLEMAVFNITDILRGADNDFAFDILVYRLALNNQPEKVKELIDNRYSNPGQFDDWNRNFNTCRAYQTIIERILQLLDHRIRGQKRQIKGPEPMAIPDLFNIAKTVAEMIPADDSREESLVKIALHGAKHSFYREAKEMLLLIKKESFRQQFAVEYPIYVLMNEDREESINMAASIANKKLRSEILLSMAPELAKQGHYKESLEFVREWAVYYFQNE